MYCTAAELKEQITELNELVTAGKIVDATINGWITKADKIINTYCASSYALPFTNQTTGVEETPPLINAMSQELASFFFYRDMGKSDEIRDKIWSRVRELLEGIQKGSQKLLDSNDDPIPMDSTQIDSPWSNRAVSEAIFTMKDPESQSYDPDDYAD